jgi:hypothetical protein
MELVPVVRKMARSAARQVIYVSNGNRVRNDVIFGPCFGVYSWYGRISALERNEPGRNPKTIHMKA